MLARFHYNTMFVRSLQQLINFMQHQQNSSKRKLFGGFKRRKPYGAIANLAFTLLRWLFLFCMGIALLVLFVAFTISHAFAEAIFTGVMPVIKLFSSTTFLVFAFACLKESI
ncbi:MAG: hypothetical protein F6K11_37005 [Leptolyngbya sp. SIO3F4]|nr:hypothetical protein [Leptolyngbya sp. SIO3F4]